MTGGAGIKHERARSLIESLWNSGGGVLSTQVLQELCVSLRRKTAHPLSIEQLRRLLQDYMSWDVVINTARLSTQKIWQTAKLTVHFAL